MDFRFNMGAEKEEYADDFSFNVGAEEKEYADAYSTPASGNRNRSRSPCPLPRPYPRTPGTPQGQGQGQRPCPRTPGTPRTPQGQLVSGLGLVNPRSPSWAIPRRWATPPRPTSTPRLRLAPPSPCTPHDISPMPVLKTRHDWATDDERSRHFERMLFQQRAKHTGQNGRLKGIGQEEEEEEEDENENENEDEAPPVPMRRHRVFTFCPSPTIPTLSNLLSTRDIVKSYSSPRTPPLNLNVFLHKDATPADTPNRMNQELQTQTVNHRQLQISFELDGTVKSIVDDFQTTYSYSTPSIRRPPSPNASSASPSPSPSPSPERNSN